MGCNYYLHKLFKLGWEQNFNNEYKNGNRYVSIDENYIDIYTWINGNKCPSYLTTQELEYFYELIKEKQND